MTHQYELILEMIEVANNRIAELEGQINTTHVTLVEMQLPQEEITRIIDGLKEVSGFNAKHQEVARLKLDLANL